MRKSGLVEEVIPVMRRPRPGGGLWWSLTQHGVGRSTQGGLRAVGIRRGLGDWLGLTSADDYKFNLVSAHMTQGQVPQDQVEILWGPQPTPALTHRAGPL